MPTSAAGALDPISSALLGSLPWQGRRTDDYRVHELRVVPFDDA
jgi:hypothetical protein